MDSGYPLAPGDTIITTQHAADIQGEGGFAIRLKPFSELYIPLDARDERVLQLNRGSLIVDYDGKGPLPFRVRSGGLNVDVKGTTFVVEAGDIAHQLLSLLGLTCIQRSSKTFFSRKET